MISRESMGIYSEVAGFQTLLNYQIHNAGCCKILLHPQWRSSCYPATMFVICEEAVIKEILSKYVDFSMEGTEI